MIRADSVEAAFRSLSRLDRRIVVVIAVDVAAGPVTETVLNDDERKRARRYVFGRDRRRFVATRTALRNCLGALLQTPPRSVQIAYAPGGKPVLHGRRRDLRFNLSHGGDYALIAVALGRDVGVDVERVREIDTTTLARRIFSPCEEAALAGTASQYRLEAFYRGWTRKESFVKALGRGLDFPLDGFDVSLGVHEPVLLACRAAPSELKRWTMSTPSTPAGYVAALTVQGDDFDLHQL